VWLASSVSTVRGKKTTFVIVDAQSAKNTDTAEQKGYDMGKKVSGIDFPMRLPLRQRMSPLQ